MEEEKNQIMDNFEVYKSTSNEMSNKIISLKNINEMKKKSKNTTL